jgi:hypothetical protein
MQGSMNDEQQEYNLAAIRQLLLVALPAMIICGIGRLFGFW